MKKLFFSVFAGTALLLCGPVIAEEEHRQLGAHVHGHGILNIAIEGKKVAMELEAPGADIVGFEHEASTDDQKEQVKAAINKLKKDAAKLFVFSGAAKCTFTSAKAELEGSDEHDAHYDHSDEGKEKHEDHDHEEDAKKEHHDHEHEKEAGHEGEAEHSEFHVAYKLECAAPGELKELNVSFFKQFPNSKELEVTVVNDAGSKTHEATPDQPLVKLVN